MSTLTNFNVKVPIDPTAFPASDSSVIWDASLGAFALGTIGSSGITVKSDPASVEVSSATILKFTNGKITAGITGEAVVDSIWFANDTLSFGNITNLTVGGATAGFIQDGSEAKTHVTPKFKDNNTALLTIPIDTDDTQSALLEYPDNYITYGEAILTSDGGDDTGGTDGSGGGGTDTSNACSSRFRNTTKGITNTPLSGNNGVEANDLIAISTADLNSLSFTLTADDVNQTVIFTSNTAPSIVYFTATITTYNQSGDTTFTVDTVTWPASPYDTYDQDDQKIWCIDFTDPKSLTLELGGEGGGQLGLFAANSGSDGTNLNSSRKGMLLTSQGNILYFKGDAKTISGSFIPVSSSAKMSFNPEDSSLNFDISGDSSPTALYKPILYVSKSGDDAKIGIGTTKPESLLEIKSTQTSSKGVADLILAVPNASVSKGNESSRISFVIEDQTLSGSEFTISGSTGAIFSRVLSENTSSGYQFGSLVFEVDGPTTATQNIKGLEIGYGLNSFLSDDIASVFTGSVVIGAGDTNPTPGMYVRNYQGDDLVYIGQDIISPSNFESGQLLLYYNGNSNPKIVLRTEPGEDSYINVDANGSNISNFGIGTSSPNAKLEVVGDTILSGSLVVSQSFTASGLYYPDTDGLDRQVLKTDGLGNLSFGYAENVEIALKNVSGGTINKGTPCFITASGTSGNVAGVIPADAGDPTKMPAGVIAGETLADEAEGLGLVNGFIQGVDTSTFASGDTIYVAVGGGYTNVKPTGSGALIQKLGNVEKSDASNGSGVINGPGYYNELPNWEEGKIQVGTSTYPVTSSVISLDETNKYVSGSESAKFQIGTYAFGYNTFPGFGFDVTGSGIIVSSSLPDEHYPMVKIGETELLDLTTDTALDHTFTIHNVDNFQVTSGSEPTNVSTNKLFEHIGDIFKVYSKGNSTPIFTASSSSIALQGKDVSILPSSGVPYVKVPNTSTTPQYVPVFDAVPNNPSGQELKYITASTFTGGGGKSTSHTGYLELKTNSQTVLMAGPSNGIYAADYTSGNDTLISYNHGGTIPTPGVTTDNEYPYNIRGCMIDLHHDVSELSFNARMRDQGQQAGGDEIFISLWYNSSGAADTFTQSTYTCIATGSTTFPGSSLNIINVKISAAATGLSLVEGGSLYYGFGWVDAPPSAPDVFVNWSLNLYE